MLVKDIERALSETEKSRKTFGGMALSEGALVHLCRRIQPDNKILRLLELGGGSSTVFWSKLRSLELLNIEAVTLEHDSSWLNTLKEEMRDDPHIQISPQSLKQISDKEWESLFACPEVALTLWHSCGRTVPEDQNRHYTIHNAFYRQADSLPLDKASVDVLIVDGPHGNGRSLAFPLFSQILKPDALVLIDDYDHYPFLEDLAKVFRYDELHLEPEGTKRWSLVRLNGLRTKG